MPSLVAYFADSFGIGGSFVKREQAKAITCFASIEANTVASLDALPLQLDELHLDFWDSIQRQCASQGEERRQATRPWKALSNSSKPFIGALYGFASRIVVAPGPGESLSSWAIQDAEELQSLQMVGANNVGIDEEMRKLAAALQDLEAAGVFVSAMVVSTSPRRGDKASTAQTQFVVPQSLLGSSVLCVFFAMHSTPP